MTPWTVPARLLCPWGFSRQVYWSGLPCLPPGNLPNPEIEPRSIVDGSFTIWATRNALNPSLISCRESESCSVVSDSLRPMDWGPWNSPGQNTGVASHKSNPGLPRSPALRADSLQLSYKGSPRILEWVAYPFFSRSSWSRNWTGVSCFAGRFFTNWATREVLCWNRIQLCHFKGKATQIEFGGICLRTQWSR